MRQFIIKNNPKKMRSSCELWFEDGNKCVNCLIRKKMFDGNYDVFIKTWGKLEKLDLPKDLWKICDKAHYRKVLKSYPAEEDSG